MGYECKKHRERPDGSIYWVIHFRDRSNDALAKGKGRKCIKRSELRTIGISPDATFEEAKAACAQLNARDKLDRDSARRKARTLARVSGEALIKSAFLPELDVKAFEEKILFSRFAENEETAKHQRLLSHWKFIQTLIAKLEIQPQDYADECHQIYRYFQGQKISPAYVTKLLRILNAWGQFYTKRHGGTGIEEVKAPKGKQRQSIARAYQAKEEFKGQADALTPAELTAKQSQLLDYNYNWLYLAVWLGLRPEEVDGLKDRETWRTERMDDGVTVLWVFQPKLVSVEESKAWKPIPLICPEQNVCLEMIFTGNFKRPLNKVLRRIYPEKRITAYSGRKGFTDLFLSKGEDLTNISIWMGHQSIETTWKHYKQKQVVSYKRSA